MTCDTSETKRCQEVPVILQQLLTVVSGYLSGFLLPHRCG